MALCREYKIPHSAFLDWEPEDQAKALADLWEQGSTCMMCGTADWEWQEDIRAYITDIEYCHGCNLQDKQREFSTDLPKGSTVRLVKNTPENQERINQRMRSR